VFLSAGLAIVSAQTLQSASSSDPQQPNRQQIEELKDRIDANGDPQALQQLEAMAETSTRAMTALGDHYARDDGVAPADRAKATEYYERALSLGDKSARTRLGVLYRNGVGTPANPARALELLSAAADEGDSWAMFHLAQGHLRRKFGSASRPDQVVVMLRRAKDAGNPQAVAALSNLYLWGRGGVKRDPKRSVALLEEAADQGNAVAARNLIAIYRDGRGKQIRRDRGKAASYLQKYAKLFTQDDLANEQLLNDTARASAASNSEELAKNYAEGDAATKRRILMALRGGNQNAYVLLLQRRLKAAGRYDGKLDGQLSISTIKAINDFCQSANIREQCRRGPLSVEAASALAGVVK